jgi:hypothetical protein
MATPPWQSGSGTTTVTEPAPQSRRPDPPAANPNLYDSIKGQFQAAGLPASLADNAARMLQAQRGWPDAYTASRSSEFATVLNYWQGGFYNLPSMFTSDSGSYQINHKTGSVTSLNDLQAQAGGIRVPGGPGVPNLSQDDLGTLLQLGRPAGGGGGGGGGRGGGGGGARGPIFDEAALARGITQVWQARVLGEPDNVDRLVKQYISEATAFARRGGSLDFSTWAEGKVAETQEFKTIYRNKPAGIDPGAYLADYLNATKQAGVAPRNMVETVRQGAASGASAAGFSEGLQQQASFQSANQGAFSQRFARQLQGMGVVGT